MSEWRKDRRPWRGAINLCFVGGVDANGFTDEQTDRILDALDALAEFGIFDEGGGFSRMDDEDVIAGSPLDKALQTDSP